MLGAPACDGPSPPQDPKTAGLAQSHTANNVTFLGVSDRAGAAVFILDLQTSVWTFDSARRAVLAAVAEMHEPQQFAVIPSKGRNWNRFSKRFLPADARGKEAASDGLGFWSAGGLSDVGPALAMAFQLLDGVQGKDKVIFLVADGGMDDTSLRKLISERNRDRSVRIHTFLWGNDMPVDIRAMKEIAAENGGHFRMLDVKQIEGLPN